MTTHHISFSGGLASAVTALLAREQGLLFTLLFADTLIEDEDLYRFVFDVARVVDAPVVRLCDGRTPWQVFRDKRYHGNSRTAHCSQVLKTDQVAQWLADNASPDDPLVLGMDWSEQDRIDRAAERWAPRPVVSLLNQYGVYREQYPEWLERYGLRRPRLYDLGFPHNNCGGFCVRAGLAQHRALLRHFPDRFREHEREQNQLMQAVPTARPHLRKVDGDSTAYLTMQEFREAVEADPQLGLWDDGPFGCGCFVDDDPSAEVSQ